MVCVCADAAKLYVDVCVTMLCYYCSCYCSSRATLLTAKQCHSHRQRKALHMV
jgi:hypothetical protein